MLYVNIIYRNLPRANGNLPTNLCNANCCGWYEKTKKTMMKPTNGWQYVPSSANCPMSCVRKRSACRRLLNRRCF